MKKADIFLIILYIALSIFATYTLVDMNNANANAEKYFVIKVDGEVVHRGDLPATEEEIIPIETKYGRNVIRVMGDEVSIIEADCPNKIGIQDSPASEVGEILACLPNRLAIEILSDNGESETDVNSY